MLSYSLSWQNTQHSKLPTPLTYAGLRLIRGFNDEPFAVIGKIIDPHVWEISTESSTKSRMIACLSWSLI